MKEVKAIIGANFGDEGKGLMTDYICSKADNPIVIRFNSGSQAGHTVVTDNNIRHVFGHLGSGTFTNTPTFLSKYFVVNPLTFLKEFNEISNSGFIPDIFVDEECVVTTPYDMIINQIVETFRGENNHGSCGLGFNETLVRSNNICYKIKVKDLINKGHKEIAHLLKSIKEEYVYKRLEELGVNHIDDEFKEILKNDNLIYNFIDDIKLFIKIIKISSFREINKDFNTLVFEGAQGLMLHEGYKYFPHVTHSKTGIENIIDILKENYNNILLDEKNTINIEAIYVTRTYLTRHGAGPLPGELKCQPYNKIVDLTNIPNRYQGTLRFALLDLDLLKDNIDYDFSKATNCNFKIRKSLAITCLDQIDDIVKYKCENIINDSNKELFINNAIKKVNPYKCYISEGVTRNTIKLVKVK